MKKLTKVALIIAAIVGVIGICCLVGAASLGLTWGTFTDMVEDGKFNFGPEDTLNIGKDGKADGSLIEVKEDFNSIDVDFEAGDLKIYYDNVETVQIQQENVKGFKCYVDEGTLHVEESRGIKIVDTNRSITIRVPKDYSFTEFELEVGAGEATVDGVIANEASLSVGAGKITITNLDAKEVDVSADTGELYLEVVGKQEDYSYNLECDIGELQIGQESYTGLGTEKKINNPNATRFVEADCDIGKVQIDFTE